MYTVQKRQNTTTLSVTISNHIYTHTHTEQQSKIVHTGMPFTTEIPKQYEIQIHKALRFYS